MTFSLPDKDHPVWKLAQSVVSLLAILVMVWHGMEGGHTGGIDANDAAGAAGVGLGIKLLVQRLFSK